MKNKKMYQIASTIVAAIFLTIAIPSCKAKSNCNVKDSNSDKIKFGLRLTDKLKQKISQEKITVTFNLTDNGETKYK